MHNMSKIQIYCDVYSKHINQRKVFEYKNGYEGLNPNQIS